MNTRKAALRVGYICMKVAFFLMICLGIIYLGQTTYRYTRAVFSDEAIEAAPGRTVKINVSEDVSTDKMVEVLKENGLIEDAAVFKLQMVIADFGDTVEAGVYELNTSMTPSEILKALSETGGDES